MFPAPGVLLVWSGFQPLCHAIAIPPAGLTLGRDLLHDLAARANPKPIDAVTDDRISRSHAQLIPNDRVVAIRDLVSRNGTYAAGQPVLDSAERPLLVSSTTVLRTGRTVWLLVPDVGVYRDLASARRGRLTVGSSLTEICRELDAAARGELNVVLDGSLAVGRELARSYAETIGGEAVRFEAGRGSLGRLLESGTPVRTLVLELTAPCDRRDVEVLASWLETDLRVVTVFRTDRWFAALPAELRHALAGCRLAIPKPGPDELSTRLVDAVSDVAPTVRVHSTVIERLLLGPELDDDALRSELGEALERMRSSADEVLRGEHLDAPDVAHANCLFVPARVAGRRAMPRQPASSIPPSDVTWSARRLCVDGRCHGVIGVDGACAICGRPEPLGDPFR